MTDRSPLAFDTSTESQTAISRPLPAVSASTRKDGSIVLVTAAVQDGDQIASITTGASAATSTAATTPPPTVTVMLSSSASAASSSAASSGSSGSNGIPLGTLLPAVIVPVAILLIAIPLVIFWWFHKRNKKLEQEQRRMSTPDMRGPPTNTALLHKQSQPSLSMNTPFSDGEKSLGTGTYGSYEAKSSFDNEPAEAIALNARNRSYDRDGSPPRGPSPTLPSPSVTKRPQRPERPKDRPTTQEAWPLPAHATLPEPLSPTSSKQLPPPAMPQSHANGHHLPPVQLSEPLSMHDSIATDSSIYDLSSSAGNFPEPPKFSSRAANPGVTDSVDMFNPASHNKRESDLISEMSNPDESTARTPRGRRDTDAVSVVSAITSRSRSQRRKSTASAVSALSPMDEHQMPMQPFPMR